MPFLCCSGWTFTGLVCVGGVSTLWHTAPQPCLLLLACCLCLIAAAWHRCAALCWLLPLERGDLPPRLAWHCLECAASGCEAMSGLLRQAA